MIETLMDLVGRELDAQSQRLHDLEYERTRLATEREYWRAGLTFDAASADTAGAVASILNFGARADRELKNLADKDFVIQERISECRMELVGLKRRLDVLREVMVRRESVRIQAAKRRADRERVSQGAARKAARGGEETWP